MEIDALKAQNIFIKKRGFIVTFLADLTATILDQKIKQMAYFDEELRLQQILPREFRPEDAEPVDLDIVEYYQLLYEALLHSARKIYNHNRQQKSLVERVEKAARNFLEVGECAGAGRSGL